MKYFIADIAIPAAAFGFVLAVVEPDSGRALWAILFYATVVMLAHAWRDSL